MATINKYKTSKGENRYRIAVYAGKNPKNGKQVRIVRSTDSYRKATMIASRLELSVKEGKFTTDKPKLILFNEVYEEWYSSYINTVRESTWNRTRGMFKNHILPALGDIIISEITTKDVQEAVNSWFKVSTQGYKRWYNYVIAVLDYAVRQEYIEKNKGKAIVLPRHEETAGDKFENFWTKEQMNKFFLCIDPNKNLDIFTMFRVLAYTGCRRGELLALQWRDVDFKKNTIRINKTLTQGERGHQIVNPPKTRAGRRTVPIDNITMTCSYTK